MYFHPYDFFEVLYAANGPFVLCNFPVALPVSRQNICLKLVEYPRIFYADA